MELAKPGFIQNYCTPNAILTLKEYLEDYAMDGPRQAAESAIQKALARMDSEKLRNQTIARMKRIENGERDLYF